MAIDHADGRLLEVLEGGLGPLEEPPELRLLLREEAPALLVRLGPRVGGIGAGREDGRSAGDDHHARRVVVSELREGPRQVREHGVAQRVPALRPAERHRGHGAFPIERDVLAHARASCRACSKPFSSARSCRFVSLTMRRARSYPWPVSRPRATEGARISSRKRSKARASRRRTSP